MHPGRTCKLGLYSISCRCESSEKRYYRIWPSIVVTTRRSHEVNTRRLLAALKWKSSVSWHRPEVTHQCTYRTVAGTRLTSLVHLDHQRRRSLSPASAETTGGFKPRPHHTLNRTELNCTSRRTPVSLQYSHPELEFISFQLMNRGVHGNGKDWDPMGPMEFPWEWE